MPRLAPSVLGAAREGSRSRDVDEPVTWLCRCDLLVFRSSGGRLRVGGLLEDESGVRAGTECSAGRNELEAEPKLFIGKSH